MRTTLVLSLFAMLSAGCSGGDDPLPAIPQGLKATAGNAQVTLTWQATSDPDVRGARVFVGEQADSLTESAFVAAPSATHVVTGLTNGTRYHFALEAEDGDGRRSVRTATVSATPEAGVEPPAEPKGFFVLAGDGQVTAYWDFEDGEDPRGVHLFWGTDAEALGETRFVEASETEAVVTGLTNGTVYLFAAEVEAQDGRRSSRTLERGSRPFEPDIESPTIVDTTPADGATGVDPDGLLSVTFSEPMDISSVQIVMEPDRVLRQFFWNPDRTELVTGPETRWAQGKSYEAKVTGNDVSGNPLEGVDVFAFTVGYEQLAPAVSGASPESGLLEVPTNTRISVTFSEPMEPISTNRALSVDPDVPLSYANDASQTTFTWTPQIELAPGTQYTVTVGASAQSARGEALGSDIVFDFTTALGPDETPPSVGSFLPEAGVIGEPRHFEIALAFSEAMDPAWTQAALVFPSHPGLTGTFTWSNGGSVMRFTPDEDPAYGEMVSWTLLGQAKDLAGHEIGSDLVASFRLIRLETVTIPGMAQIDGEVAVLPPDSEYGTHRVFTDNAVIDIGSINYTYLGPSIQRGFLSFDLSGLPEELTRIQDADLKFIQTSQYGGCENTGPFYLASVPVGPELTPDDFDVAPLVVNQCDQQGTCEDKPYVLTAPCTEFWWDLIWTGHVNAAIQNDWDDRQARMHLSAWRLRMAVEATDMFRRMSFLANHWRIEPDRRPKLIVSYEIP